jgi:hypothetical protein
LIQKGFRRFDGGSDELSSLTAFVKLKKVNGGKPLLILVGLGYRYSFQEKQLANFA